MNTEDVIQTTHLKKHFRTVHAVDDVSLNIRKGEIFGFLGPNGAGKTTTISMLLGLTYPTAGEVHIFGERVTPSHTAILKRVGTMGAPALMNACSAYRNLQTLAYLYPNLPKQRIDEVLALVDLQSVSGRTVGKFSTGMKQRLGLALELLNKPDILILDEPTNGMDPAGMHEIRLLLRTLSEQGVTIFLSSHLLHEMELTCDRIAVIQQGKIIAQGTVSELLTSNEVIRIRTAQPEQTALALQALPGTHTIKTDNSLVEVQGIASEQVIAFLVKKELIPQEISRSRPDLESIFLQLTQQLNVVLSNKGLSVALRELVQQWSTQTGIAATIDIEGAREHENLLAVAEDAFFRISQEALSNIMHHSQATHVQVCLTYQSNNAVTLTIADNGLGFDIKTRRESGFGLHSMQERMKILAGTVTIESTPGQGTHISVGYTKHEIEELIER